jgi:hypothetical protein
MAARIFNDPIDNYPTIISPRLNAWTDAPSVLHETTHLRAYIYLKPHKPMELPPAAAQLCQGHALLSRQMTASDATRSQRVRLGRSTSILDHARRSCA